jgi:transposase
MPGSGIASVRTRGITFGPIVRHYFDRCGIARIIDENVAVDPRRKVLTHGQASVAMITGILCQVMQLYNLCKFAEDTTILDVILPETEPKEYFDDRLGDTLDAIYKYGIGNLEMLITQHMIGEFGVGCSIAHNDTTSASVYGSYDRGDSVGGIEITYGFSKKHREDLKQLVWSMSVSSDHAFPLFQQAYSGNTADVETYVEQWWHLIDLLGRRDFLFVADSKLVSKENMTHIHDNGGYFLAPVPMYESYKGVFHDALNTHDYELLIGHKGRFNRGFEVPIEVEHNDKRYGFRMIIIYDPGLFARKRRTLDNRIEKTKAAFKELEGRLNKYNLKTDEAIRSACRGILEKYHSADLFEYEIHNVGRITYKNKTRGRPPRNGHVEKVEVVNDWYSIELRFKGEAYEEELLRCGYYPLITNKPQEGFTTEETMFNHKNQYKSEHINRRAKGAYGLEPIYLHKPHRIETFLFLFKIALQMIVLMERTARNNIAKRDKGLDKFRPNRKDVRNPKTEYLLKEFQYIVSGKILLESGEIHPFVSELNELQSDILEILEVPRLCFTYGYLFDTS